MKRNDEIYRAFVEILREELVPAMGCTEPIAIAYAAAAAREKLGCLPDEVEIAVSGNIIKNVKSVVVPHTGGMRGLEAAAAAGIGRPGGAAPGGPQQCHRGGDPAHRRLPEDGEVPRAAPGHAQHL